MFWYDYREKAEAGVEISKSGWTSAWIPMQFVKSWKIPFTVTAGCYAYAYDETRQIENVEPDPYDPNVIYLGTAGDRGIRRRTDDFKRSVEYANKQRDPENHAMAYRGIYKTSSLDNMYVAYYPMFYASRDMARDAETDFIDNFEMIHGNIPLLNRKHEKSTMIIGSLIDLDPAELATVSEFFKQ
jgi:hypothetical protein